MNNMSPEHKQYVHDKFVSFMADNKALIQFSVDLYKFQSRNVEEYVYKRLDMYGYLPYLVKSLISEAFLLETSPKGSVYWKSLELKWFQYCNDHVFDGLVDKQPYDSIW